MVRLLRTAATNLAAAVLLLALAACSDAGPSRTDIVEKIRSSPQLAGTPDQAVDCLADWYMEHATPQQREAFLTGQADLSPPDNPEAEAAMLKCLKLAAKVKETSH